MRVNQLPKPRWTFEFIRSWRVQERGAGRPWGLRDFFDAHDTCWSCKGAGQKLDSRYTVIMCSECGGSGNAPVKRSAHDVELAGRDQAINTMKQRIDRMQNALEQIIHMTMESDNALALEVRHVAEDAVTVGEWLDNKVEDDCVTEVITLARKLIAYRDRAGALSFQLEKLDGFIDLMRNPLDRIGRED